MNESARETATQSAAPTLRVSGVSKSFPGVLALADVSLDCRPGEVHALVGENGSGKSTLVKVACGVVVADAGELEIGGEVVARPSPRTTRQLGLAAAYQDTSLVPELSVLENIRLAWIGPAPSRDEIGGLLERHGVDFPLDAAVASLSPAARQLLEVTRAVLQSPKALLLDEPTAALDASSIAILFRIIAEAKAAGTAILYISHRLEEVQQIADRVSVLRDGELQATHEGRQWSVAEIVEAMVGDPIDLSFPKKADAAALGGAGLALSGFNGPKFGPVDLAVRKGEIVGIAGAEGNGQRELVRSLIGLLPSAGTVGVAGEEVDATTPAAARRAGISFQSGDRATEGIFGALSVMTNSTLPVVDQLGPAGTVSRRREMEEFIPVATELGIVAASPDQPIESLSGGNQQKAVLARPLLEEAEVIVVDEPTQGVDARARLDIYRKLRERAEAGGSILVNSSDSLELAGLCDRVYVISRGRVVTELAGADLHEEAIVEGFVAAKSGEGTTNVEAITTAFTRGLQAVHRALARPWVPLLVLALLTLVVGAYAATQNDAFLTTRNIENLLVAALPLAVVTMGQQAVLLTRGFDISVGAMMSLSVVLCSFWLINNQPGQVAAAILGVLAVGVAAGLVNGIVVRILRVDAIIATIGMLGILSGIALIERPSPGGLISIAFSESLLTTVGFIPVAGIVIVAAAVLAQLALTRSRVGLAVRATGFAEEASNRVGVRSNLIKISAFVVAGAMAALAGIFLGAQTGTGDPLSGANYALLSLAACVIGGASLGGGRGSFIGCILAAVFLGLLKNVTPLIDIPDGYSELATGVLTLLAVLAYSANQRAARTH